MFVNTIAGNRGSMKFGMWHICQYSRNESKFVLNMCICKQDNCKTQAARQMKLDIYHVHLNCRLVIHLEPIRRPEVCVCVCHCENENVKPQQGRGMKFDI